VRSSKVHLEALSRAAASRPPKGDLLYTELCSKFNTATYLSVVPSCSPLEAKCINVPAYTVSHFGGGSESVERVRMGALTEERETERVCVRVRGINSCVRVMWVLWSSRARFVRGRDMPRGTPSERPVVLDSKHKRAKPKHACATSTETQHRGSFLS
jgi:hypothetical protein